MSQIDSHYSDTQLLFLLKEDNKDAFVQIYRQHWEVMYTASVKVLRDEQLAQDVLQDVFLALWHRRKEINLLKSSLSAYLRTAAQNRSIHYIQKNITKKDYLSKLAQTIEHLQYATSPDEPLCQKEILGTLHNAIGTMPPQMQKVFLLSRENDLSHAQIAHRLNISEQTVRKHMQRALRFLKKIKTAL